MADPQETIPGVDDAATGPAALAGPEGDLSDLGYRVSLDQFSGPMDLLLYLVKRTELDIVDIPLATITDQFVATVAEWRAMDLEVAGDFIVMAATLLELKARMLAPPPPEGEEGEPQEEDEPLDPRADLIRRLLQYRRFKDAALLIDELQDVRVCQAPRQLREAIPEDPAAADDITLEDLDVHLLFRAYEYQMARISGLGPRRVLMDEVPMELRMGKVVETLQAERLTTLKKLLEAEPSLVGQAGVLIATLEVVRQRFAEAKQLEQYGQVDLRFREESERAIATSQPPEEVEEPGKRRKRIPLVTYQAPNPVEDGAEIADEPEERVETEEQRFLRELDASCDLTNVMAKAADIEGAFISHWQEQHPGELPPTIAVERVLAIRAAEEEKRLAEEKEAKRKAAEEIRAAKRAASWEQRKDFILGAKARREAEKAEEKADVGSRTSEVPVEEKAGDPPQAVVEQPMEPVAVVSEVAVPPVEPVAIVPATPVEPVAVVEQAVPAPPVEEPAAVVAAVESPAPIVDPPAEPQAVAVVESVPEPVSEPVAPVVEASVVPQSRPEPELSPEAEAILAAFDEQQRKADDEDEPRRRDQDEDDEELTDEDPAVVNAALLAGNAPVAEDEDDELVGGDLGLPHLDHAPVAPAASIDPASMRHVQSDAADSSDADDAAILPSEDEPAVHRAALTTGMASAIGTDDAEPVSPPVIQAGEALDRIRPLHSGAASAIDDDLPEGAVQLESTSDTAERIAALPGATTDLDDDPVAPPPAPGRIPAAILDDEPLPAYLTDAAGIDPDDQDPVSAPAPDESAVGRSAISADAAAEVPDDDIDEPTAETAIATPIAPPPATVPVFVSIPAPVAPAPLVAIEPSPPPVPEPPPPPPPVLAPPAPRLSPNPEPRTAKPTLPPPLPMPAPPTHHRVWLIAALLALVNVLGWVGYCWWVKVPRNLLEVAAAPIAEGDQPWVWCFNLDAVAPEAVGVPLAVTPQIEPAVPGRWAWRDQRTLVFTPDAPLPPAFSALVHLKAEALRAPHGFHLAQDLATLLRTSPAQPTGAEAVAIAADGTTTVDVAFDRPVDPRRIAERVRVDAGGARIPATSVSGERSDRVRLAVGPAVDHDGKPAQVRFTPVDPGPAKLDGPVRLDPRWQGDVTLGHRLRATTVSAEAPARGRPSISIAVNEANAPRDVLVSQVRVEPAVPFAALPTPEGLRLEGDFVPGTAYTVRVTAAWPSAAGAPVNAYPAAAELPVTIPDRTPGLWFVDPSRGRLDITGVNLGTVLVRVHDSEGGIALSRALDLGGDRNTDVSRSLDADLLLAELPPGRYRVVAEATDGSGTVRGAELTATVRSASVPPERLAAALLTWAAERLAGHGGAARVSVAALGL